MLHHVHRVRALLVFVFLLLFAGGLRLRFGKNALRLFAFPENGLVQAFRKGFPDHFTERRLALVHFAFVIRYQNVRFQRTKRTHTPAEARAVEAQRPRSVDKAHKRFITILLCGKRGASPPAFGRFRNNFAECAVHLIRDKPDLCTVRAVIV